MPNFGQMWGDKISRNTAEKTCQMLTFDGVGKVWRSELLVKPVTWKS